MVCLGLEPGAAVWKAQTIPLSYGGTQTHRYYKIVLISCANGNNLFINSVEIWPIANGALGFG